MCDFVAGEMLFIVPDDGAVAEITRLFVDHHSEELRVSLIETLDDRLGPLELPEEARIRPPSQYWRLRVPPGEEHVRAATFTRAYQLMAAEAFSGMEPNRYRRAVFDVAAVPNLTLRVSGPATSTFNLTKTHETYKRLAGVGPSAPTGAKVSVAILDTGVPDSLPSPPVRAFDFVSPPQFAQPIASSAPDRNGHGTVVASIVTDLVPDVDLFAYKIADDSGLASEWDLIAALVTLADADVVNISAEFRHDREDGVCRVCGRHSGSSRSIVCEEVLNTLTRAASPPVIVAAAGNAGAASLAFPARYDTAVAVGSLTSTLERSPFSNYGALDHESRRHPSLFFMPGGDNTPGHQEQVATSPAVPRDFWGTSFSCAYATAIVAMLRSSHDAASTVSHLQETAQSDIQNYDPDLHGRGRMVYV
jgi:hypothetical protein